MTETRIHIKDGEIISGKPGIRRMFSEDGDWLISRKKYTGQKTYRQIKAIYGVLIPAYMDYTGYTREEVKTRTKKDWGVVQYEEIDGETYMILKSFADYSKEEMKNYITDFLHHLEFECGFVIDLETRKKFLLDEETGELTEIS